MHNVAESGPLANFISSPKLDFDSMTYSSRNVKKKKKKKKKKNERKQK